MIVVRNIKTNQILLHTVQKDSRCADRPGTGKKVWKSEKSKKEV
jgi:hypothetical protein